VRGRERGHFYELTADLMMLDHRADHAKRSRDAAYQAVDDLL
jgi:hypothetical protein